MSFPKLVAMPHIQNDHARVSVHQCIGFTRRKRFEQRYATQYLRASLVEVAQIFVVSGVGGQSCQGTLYKVFFTLRLSQWVVHPLPPNGRCTIFRDWRNTIRTCTVRWKDIYGIWE